MWYHPSYYRGVSPNVGSRTLGTYTTECTVFLERLTLISTSGIMSLELYLTQGILVLRNFHLLLRSSHSISLRNPPPEKRPKFLYSSSDPRSLKGTGDLRLLPGAWLSAFLDLRRLLNLFVLYLQRHLGGLSLRTDTRGTKGGPLWYDLETGYLYTLLFKPDNIQWFNTIKQYCSYLLLRCVNTYNELSQPIMK